LPQRRNASIEEASHTTGSKAEVIFDFFLLDLATEEVRWDRGPDVNFEKSLQISLRLAYDLCFRFAGKFGDLNRECVDACVFRSEGHHSIVSLSSIEHSKKPRRASFIYDANVRAIREHWQAGILRELQLRFNRPYRWFLPGDSTSQRFRSAMVGQFEQRCTNHCAGSCVQAGYPAHDLDAAKLA